MELIGENRLGDLGCDGRGCSDNERAWRDLCRARDADVV